VLRQVLKGVTLERNFQSLSLDVQIIELLCLYVSLVDVFHHITLSGYLVIFKDIFLISYRQDVDNAQKLHSQFYILNSVFVYDMQLKSVVNKRSDQSIIFSVL
jgi:hypothetical protein